MLDSNKAKYFALVKKYFPDCREEDVRIFEDGNDHYVFVVDQKHVFRFPRSEAHGKNDTSINAFSQKFAPLSPIPVQEMVGNVDSETGLRYQTYRFLPGQMFLEDVAKTLSQEELTAIAEGLGKFLTTLHAFPVEEARGMGVESLISPQDYADYFRDIIQVDKKAIGSLLSKNEWEWIEGQTRDFVTLSYEHPYPFVLTHSDMLPQHILIDEKTHRLCGIIDFSLRIADPANDFKSFHRYGELFLRTVYDNYPPVDEYFDRRRAFHAGDFSVAKLYESVINENKQLISQYRIQLRDYIAKHQDYSRA